jgi:pteridine reductase
MELRNKVALVTGAARKVGRTIAIRLAQHGAAVAIHYNRSRADAEMVASEIRQLGSRAEIFGAEFKSVREVEELASGVLSTFGRIDVLVNNASVFYRRPLEELTEYDWDLNLNTNLKAPFFLARCAGLAMRRQGAGKIINIADWAAIRPYNDYLPYVVSKSGLVGLTRALAKALAPEVQVNCVALGPVMPWEEYDAAELDRIAAETLVKRLGSPEDAAAAVLFFCQGTDFATGSTLLVDGGRLLN